MEGSSQLNMNDKILAGVDLTMRYLGSSVLTKLGGTDDEIAQIIHELHCLYGQRKNSINKAREVVVFIDSQIINIYAKNPLIEEVLMNFPLTEVRDVTACVNQGPYSRTCVLVAKEPCDQVYKAHVFYAKSEQKATEFYQIISSAFQVGYELFERFNQEDAKFYRLAAADARAMKPVNVSQSDRSKLNVYEDILGKSLRDAEHNGSIVSRTSTVHIPNKMVSETRHKENDFINIDVREAFKHRSQSKMAVYVERVEERSRFLLARWFHSSYRKFQKVSGRNSQQNEERL